MKKTDLCKYIVELREKKKKLEEEICNIENRLSDLKSENNELSRVISCAITLRDYMPTDTKEDLKCQN